MKRFITVLLILCMCLSVMVSCSNEEANEGGNGSESGNGSEGGNGSENNGNAGSHEHSYKSEWKKNETHHWQECEGESCLDVFGMSEHTWTDGDYTEPTPDSDGEQSYLCSVCGATRTQIVEFTGVSEEKWLESIAEEKFDNVTIHYTFTNDEMTQEHIVRITEGKVYRKMTITSGSSSPMVMEGVFEGEAGEMQRGIYLKVFLSLLAERENFVWDKESGCYTAPNTVVARVEGENEFYAIETMTGGIVKFHESGNIEYFDCTLNEATYSGDTKESEVEGKVLWTFSDYGTTVIE